MAAMKPMPSRNENTAPKFDGNPAVLSSFFDELEFLFDGRGYTPKQKKEWAVRYAVGEDQELFRTVKADPWNDFKSKIFEYYPGSAERKYSKYDLKAIVERQTSSPIQNATDFAAYKRSFMIVATYLQDQGRLTEREISAYFEEGLDSTIRTKILEQLRFKNPTHCRDDQYSTEELSKAAHFVLSNDHGPVKRGSPQERTIKTENFDMTNSNFLKENFNMSVLASEMVKLLNLQSAPIGNQGTPSTANYRVRTNCCNFCSEPGHFMKSRSGKMDGCLILIDYFRRGLSGDTHCVRP
jgi:hypothetical protein